MTKRDAKGRFVRKHFLWDGSNWNDGYIARERMRVYRPDYPKQINSLGYIERAHVVWWLANGEIPAGMVVHHRDGNTLNDKLDNLELMDRIEHNVLHRTGKLKKRETLICPICEGEIKILASEIRSRLREGRKKFFCSVECRNASMRFPMITKNCECCGKQFQTSSVKQFRNKRFCSKPCVTKWVWENIRRK